MAARHGGTTRARLRGRPLSVLVVDDSAVVRQTLTAILSQARGMSVTVAADPIIALDKLKRARPDVIVLDLEMPRMDGLTFLRKIMAENPIPIVVCSGLAGKGTDAAFRAMDEGAVEIVTKPKLGVRDFLYESSVLLVDAVRAAAQARVRPRGLAIRRVPKKLTADAVIPRRSPLSVTTDKVVSIGASTGGTEALREILEETPQINEAVRDQVSDLADALEQGSLNVEQLLEEIDSAILKLEELPLEEAEQLETETLPQSGGANSVATNNDPNQPRSARNSSSRQTYSAIGSLSSATEPPTGGRQPAEPQSTKSEKERESKTLEAQAGPSSEATAEQLQKSEQGGSQANQEQGAGSSAKGGEDGAAGKKESEDGKGEKGLKKEDDPKKSTVGLGDGKQGNQGKEGELDAKSEPQAGQSQTGKDGAAENIDQGNSPAGAKQDEKGKDKQEQQGNGKKEGA